MDVTKRSFLMTGLSYLSLAGCAALPSSGPQTRDIVAGASTTDASKTGDNSFKYALVNIEEKVLAALQDIGPGSLFSSFGVGHAGPREITVGVGDIIQVTIFESAAGGLFIPKDAGARPGNYIQLPLQTVDQKGFISVPYAGAIRAKGQSLAQIQHAIEAGLASRAIEPQVVVALTNQASSQVTVIGQVGAPNKISVNPAGERVLDVISRASGIVNPGFETFVTLQRAGRKATIYFLSLVTNPKENVFVAPGDTIYVYQQQRSFTAFGASGQSGQFKFEQEHVTLADAVGKAGGLLDNRADPGAVFVYRLEYRKNLEKMNVDLSAFVPEQKIIPTVYRGNFRDPSSFFVAKSFFLQDRDVLYVTNADQIELFKFLSLVQAVPDTIANVGADAVAVRNTARILHHY